MDVFCTWGEGPDVIVSLSGTELLLMEEPKIVDKWKHGIVNNGQIDLTAEDARKLAS